MVLWYRSYWTCDNWPYLDLERATEMTLPKQNERVKDHKTYWSPHEMETKHRISCIYSFSLIIPQLKGDLPMKLSILIGVNVNLAATRRVLLGFENLLGFEVLINGKNVVFIWFKSLLFSQKSIYFNFCRMVTKFLSSIPWNLCFYVLDYAHIIIPL